MYLPWKKSHLKHIRGICAKVPDLNLDNKDVITKERTFVYKRKFTLDMKSLQSGDDINTRGLKCYTDGSKMGDKCGLGIALVRVNTPMWPDCKSVKLADNCTIFQAEVLAISEACKVISDYLEENPELPRVVNILTDSQATIQALAAQTLDSKTVKQCCDNWRKGGLKVMSPRPWIGILSPASKT